LTSYSGQQKNNVAKDTLNFYLSQCRIRIEHAFGQLTNVWRVFKSPLRLLLENVPCLMLTTMRLHNYLIKERKCGYDVLTDKEIQQHQRNYTPIIPPDNIMRRRHILQDTILNEIKSDGLQRPQYNRQRIIR
jgi:hypothetical protein